MGARQRRWARNRLDLLRVILGDRCTVCGCQEDLEFDCREPRGPRHHALDLPRRATFYWNEARRANLQLLCADCHAAKHKEA